jgi:hypothetical protein
MPNINEAFPSNYIKAADLKGRQVTVKMDRTEYEMIGHDKKLILYFVGKDKGMVSTRPTPTTSRRFTATTPTTGAIRKSSCSRRWWITRARRSRRSASKRRPRSPTVSGRRPPTTNDHRSRLHAARRKLTDANMRPPIWTTKSRSDEPTPNHDLLNPRAGARHEIRV